MSADLRSLVLRGGTYLSVRQLLGFSISFGGIILLTRLIGPGNYGLYAAAIGIFNFLQNVGQGGIRGYLVRREGDEREDIYHQAFTLMLMLSAGVTTITLLGLPLLTGWVRMDDFGPVALAVFATLPVALLTRVPQARLERALDFRRVAFIELSAMAVFYAVAITLAFRGFGAAAPVAGWWAQQTLSLILVFWSTRYVPRLLWNPELVRGIVSYGFSFSASTLVFQSRQLVNPLVVGRYLGAEATGYVALAIRLVMALSFVKDAAWRLSVPALARIQRDRPRMVRAVTQGMKLQLLAMGPLLVGFGWVAYWGLPLVSGSQWAPAMEIFPFIALGYLTNALFNMHSSALYTLRRNMKVVSFSIVHIILFAGGAFLMVPSFGLIGYGMAEIVALASYAVIHINFVRVVGTPSYLTAGVWGAAAGLALFVHELGWWAALGLVFVVIWPRTWREVGNYARMMLKARQA